MSRARRGRRRPRARPGDDEQRHLRHARVHLLRDARRRPGRRRPAGPGPSAVHVAMSNTLNTPIEALEREYPLRIERYALRPRTGGAGAHPGGDGVVRVYRVLGRLPPRAHDRAPPPPARAAPRAARTGAPGAQPPERPPAARQVQPRPPGRRRARDPHPGRRRLGLEPTGCNNGVRPQLLPGRRYTRRHVDGRPARPQAEAAQVGAGLRSRPAVAGHRARTTTTTPSTGSRSRWPARSRASRSTAAWSWPTASTRAGKAVVWTGAAGAGRALLGAAGRLRPHDGAALAARAEPVAAGRSLADPGRPRVGRWRSSSPPSTTPLVVRTLGRRAARRRRLAAGVASRRASR